MLNSLKPSCCFQRGKRPIVTRMPSGSSSEPNSTGNDSVRAVSESWRENRRAGRMGRGGRGWQGTDFSPVTMLSCAGVTRTARRRQQHWVLQVPVIVTLAIRGKAWHHRCRPRGLAPGVRHCSGWSSEIYQGRLRKDFQC